MNYFVNIQGMDLLRKACEAKNANACYYLSGMYISGMRNPKDPKKKEFISKPDMQMAYNYAKEGCHLGNIYSCANLSQMYAKGEGIYIYLLNLLFYWWILMKFWF